jgi:hypothetical protein
MFEAEHRDADLCIAESAQLRPNAVQLVTEYQADRKARGPIEQIQRPRTRFHDSEFVATIPHFTRGRDWVVTIPPPDGILRAERRFRDALLWRLARDPTEQQGFNRSGVRDTKERTYVVKASQIVKKNRDGHGADAFIQRCSGSDLEWNSLFFFQLT